MGDSSSQDPSSTTSSTRVSFGMKRKKETTVIPVTNNLLGTMEEIGEEGEHDDDLIMHLDSRSIVSRESSKKKKKEDELNSLIIPVIVKADWRLERLRKLAETSELSPEDKARLALLEQVVDTKADGENGEQMASTTSEGDDPDYGSVPIEHFGLAILRGCGWNDGDGIGKTNRQVVPLRLPQLRPKGLGLGATPTKPAGTQTKGEKDSSDEPQLAKGSYLQLTGGPHRESYARLEAFDSDNARLIVRLAIGGHTATISQFSVRIVPQKEYERNAKCINKAEYEKVKKQIEQVENGKVEEERRKKPKRTEDEGQMEKKRRKRHEMWVRPELIVRVVDQRFQGGRLFKQKVVVCDASSPDECSIRDSQGRIFHGAFPMSRSISLRFRRGRIVAGDGHSAFGRRGCDDCGWLMARPHRVPYCA